MDMLLTNHPPTLPRFGGAGKGIFSTQPFFAPTPKKFHKILDAYIYIYYIKCSPSENKITLVVFWILRISQPEVVSMSSDFNKLDAMSATRLEPWILGACLIGVIGGVALHNPPHVKAKLKQADALVTCMSHGGNPRSTVSDDRPFGATIHGIQCSFTANEGFTSYIAEMEKRYPEAPMALGSLLRN